MQIGFKDPVNAEAAGAVRFVLHGLNPSHRPARVAQMLALTHRIEAAIDRGEYRDRADAAHRLGLTRARVSQLARLTLLASDIQEGLLDLEAVDGREPLRRSGRLGRRSGLGSS